MSGPNVRLAEPLKSQATTLARSRGQSLNALVNEAVRAYLATASEAESGAVTGGPSVAGGRSLPPTPERSGQKSGRSGRFDFQLHACARRSKPSGILGADVFAEWQRWIRVVQHSGPKPGAFDFRLNRIIQEI